mmetsp:Transcript_67537/g.170430  ORF Transcript_67537/g.170430 Transcript_67537/m.170430 type:complete len:172 (+) Transcript_67537:66-581(+)
MKTFCRPFRCLSFLGGKRPAEEEYAPVDGTAPAKAGDGDEDEDDFFGDSWGDDSGTSGPSQQVKSQGVETRPTLETTTKRGSSSPAPSVVGAATSSSIATQQPKAMAPKKEQDFFGELGMEPEYRAPRILDTSKPSSSMAAMHASGVGALLDDADGGQVVGGGWGVEDMDL